MTNKLRVGVIFGGCSGEHAVSLTSAASVLAAIPRDRYEPVPIGIARDGRWYVGEQVHQALLDKAPGGRRATLLPEPHGTCLHPLDASEALQLDVLFPVLHGPRGEDGTIQGLFEMADVPYVGCGVLASAVAMDKAAFKDVMRANGIQVVEHVLLSRAEILADVNAAAARVTFDFPVFCKPANMGSSVGVSRANDADELRAGLREAARWDRRILVERGVDAREIEVAVLGNEAAQASVAGEIKPCADFYDYEAKYETGDASELLIPAPLDDAKMAELRAIAVKAFGLIDGAGLSRVDFLVENGTGTPYLNEINTLPGFTPISMYPKLWDATGIPYPELIHQLIQLALSRHAEKQGLARTTEK